jgi:hypothetical protein
LSETPRQLASAATLAALFTALSLAELRFEGYETEKHALLVIQAAVILAAGVINLFRWLFSPASRLQSLTVRGLLAHPILLAALLILGAASISTVFSLDPAQSLFGAPNRGQGLLALVCYVLLFAGAAWGGRTLRSSLLPAIVMIGVPVALYALLLRLNGVARPGATMGNPNFLAAWLTPAILFVAHGAWTMWRTSRRVMFGLGAALAIMGAALLVASSRGALLALGAGGLISALTYAAITRQRRLTIGLGVIVIAGLLVYGVAGATLPAGRLFQPIDPFRREAWNAAADLLSEIHLPLLDAGGSRDPFAALRPLVGYGVDVLPLTQSRFGYVTANTIFVDSFHNLIFDSLASMGVFGLLARLALYLSATGAALGALGLLSRAREGRWLLVQALGAAVGALALTVFALPPPVGAGLGLVGGTAAWLVGAAFRSKPLSLPARSDNPPSMSGGVSEREILIIGLLGIAAADWVALQFGFATASSAPIFWIMLGLLAALTGKQSTYPLQFENSLLAVAALAAGAVLISSLGVTVDSQYVRHAVGVRELPLLLLAIGGVCAWFTGQIRLLLPIGLVWLAWAMLEELITRLAGQTIDAALIDRTNLALAVAPLALKGFGGALLALLGWVWYSGKRYRALAAATLIAGIGGVYYAANHTGAVLHGVGGNYADLGRIEANAVARLFYEAGIQVAPLDSHIDLDLLRISQPGDPAADALLREHPYIVHSLDWMRLLDRSIALYGRAPSSRANVIRNGGFDLDMEHWLTYGDIDGRVEGGAFVFRDLGEDAARAVVFQLTGATAFGDGLRVQLDLRSDIPAEVSVILHTPDWSQQAACVFTLPPGAPFAEYSLIVPTPSVWNEVQLAIYSLTDGAAISVDNVGLWVLENTVTEQRCG